MMAGRGFGDQGRDGDNLLLSPSSKFPESQFMLEGGGISTLRRSYHTVLNIDGCATPYVRWAGMMALGLSLSW